MRRLVELLTVFDWVTPSIDFAEDLIKGGTLLEMDRKNWKKALPALEGVDYRGGHKGGGSSTYGIIVKDEDAAEVEQQLSAAGVTWK